jgi:DNA-binding IclR family transcriptional regulator
MAEAVIKSVRRVFEILEYFDRERRPLAAKEISNQLNYPLMSAHQLLKSMHQLGYMDFDAPNWTYMPSRSFITILDWVPDIIERETGILDFATALNRETRETINISRRIGTDVRIIHGLESVHTVGVSVAVGTTMPAGNSLTGLVALSSLNDEQFSKFLSFINNAKPHVQDWFDKQKLDDVRAELNKCGTAAKSDIMVEGVGAVCVPVKTLANQETLVVGVVGPSHRIAANADKHRATIAALAKEHGIKTAFKLK